SLPALADEEVEPIDLGSAIAEIDVAEAPSIENAEQDNQHELFEEPSTALIDLEPEAYPVWKNAINDADPITAHAEATEVNVGGGMPLIETTPLENDIHPEIPVPPADWNRLLSKQEDIGRQLTSLDNKARNTARLSYTALGLAVTALCAALATGYLNVQTRAEQTRLKDTTAMLEKDKKGLNEIFERNDHSIEGNAEKPSHFSDTVSKPEEKAITAEVTPSQATEPKQATAVLSVAPVLINKKPSVPPVRKTLVKLHKPALITAHTKPPAKASSGSTIETGAKWTVNLASFRQIEDATKKAEELRRKGISVKVMKVDVNRATWYRLSVPGFKTKEAASTHSTRLKKMLHQNSIWVAAI
ncbi:MAG: SPOR domain-containing protein, partial [Methylococcaceae bacterium]|nr:SPOR domain-containing protein [Methylococcaceae bacterium]